MPIRVVPKAKRRRRFQNVFLADRGFRDQSDDYDHVLHYIDGGPVLRKLTHPVPDLNAPVDPAFYSEFLMRQDVVLSHLNPNLHEKDIYPDRRILVCVQQQRHFCSCHVL